MRRRRGQLARNTEAAIDEDQCMYFRGSRSVTDNDYDDTEATIDNYDDKLSSFSSPRPKTLLSLLRELEHKKGLIRENALCSIILILNTRNVDHYSLNKYFATCLYQILGSIKRGSTNEKGLAAQVLGLMAMTLSGTDYAQELYKESIPPLAGVLTSKRMKHWDIVMVLQSLAIVTFFCANNSVETQAAMEIIWDIVLPKSKSNVSADKQVPVILAAAISAWSLLITTVAGWELSYNQWQGAISHLSKMLESDDDSVCVAAGEALAVIFDRDSLDKFSDESDRTNSTISPITYSEKKKLIKETILKQIEKVSEARSGGTSPQQMFCNAGKANWDVFKYFKEGQYPQTCERIKGHKLALSSWSRVIQLTFLKNYVGEEIFSEHMLENEMFQRLFKFKPSYKENDVPRLYQSTMEKVESHVYLPKQLDPELFTRKQRKEERQLRQSIISKSKQKMMNKARMFAEERKGNTYAIESEM